MPVQYVCTNQLISLNWQTSVPMASPCWWAKSHTHMLQRNQRSWITQLDSPHQTQRMPWRTCQMPPLLTSRHWLQCCLSTGRTSSVWCRFQGPLQRVAWTCSPWLLWWHARCLSLPVNGIWKYVHVSDNIFPFPALFWDLFRSTHQPFREGGEGGDGWVLWFWRFKGIAM